MILKKNHKGFSLLSGLGLCFYKCVMLHFRVGFQLDFMQRWTISNDVLIDEMLLDQIQAIINYRVYL